MRILGARIFSKSFGGKILEIWTAFTMEKILYTHKLSSYQLTIK